MGVKHAWNKVPFLSLTLLSTCYNLQTCGMDCAHNVFLSPSPFYFIFIILKNYFLQDLLIEVSSTQPHLPRSSIFVFMMLSLQRSFIVKALVVKTHAPATSSE